MDEVERLIAELQRKDLQVSRRDILKLASAGSLGAILAACGVSPSAGPSPTTAPASGSAPAPAQSKPGDQIVIKVASSGFPLPGDLDQQYSDHAIAVMKLQELLKKYAGDKVKLEVFYNSVLGDEQKTVQGARLGVPAPMATAASFAVDPFSPSMGFFSLPYIFKNRAQARKVLNTMWDELDQKMIKEAGIRAVTYFGFATRLISNSKRPVRSIEDMKGLKLRVPPQAVMIETFKSIGVEPAPIAYSEIFTATQQGTIDGLEVLITTILSGKFYEVVKYGTPAHYNMLLMMIIIGEQYYQNLPKDVQEAISKAGRETSQWAMDYNDDLEARALKELKAKGMQIDTLSDEGEWENRSKAVWPKLYDKVGGKAMIDRVEQILKSS